ncbi:MAG: glycoside hydrolase family 2 TIM barrel-domain containing protein [Gemmatales bacterium]
MKATFILLISLLLLSHVQAQETPRKTTSLNGEWQFHRDGSKENKDVTLPTHWETHEGLKFDGVGWYEKTIELPELPVGRRLLLHFDGVATHATVYWNDVKLGGHLGAWTPFRFDVSQHVHASGGRQPPEKIGKGAKDKDSVKPTQGADAPRSHKHVIRVRVDEKVGHNTQGFLPIIAPHFGGIWQGVRLVEVPSTYINDLEVSFLIDKKKKSVQVIVPVAGDRQIIKTADARFEQINGILMRRAFDMRAFGIEDVVDKNRNITLDSGQQPLEEWQPSNPVHYLCTLSLPTGDRIELSCANRTIETKGDQFLLNGQPLSIRGVLNWGYYPPSLAPTPTEEQWRANLKLIKSWGFNLMKCCLWVPPKRLLEIADEEGVLIWLEYPTWHPKLTAQYQAELMQEYKEFHELDRNHPSVILRSLTCETGPGADIKVIQALYDQCKKMSGGLVVDDSSWIEWNRVFDFYDDHPYGNNHTWVATLDRLKKYIANSKYGVKPLCLGEAIAADTWVPTKPMLEAIAKAKADPKQAWSLDERGYPFWVPGFFDANRKWLERMGRACGGPVDEEKLYQDSLKYAGLMRKYQMEAYRREVPNGGYVVSVLRDFPLAGMGLVNYLGQPKWGQEDWKWHGATDAITEKSEGASLLH